MKLNGSRSTRILEEKGDLHLLTPRKIGTISTIFSTPGHTLVPENNSFFVGQCDKSKTSQTLPSSTKSSFSGSPLDIASNITIPEGSAGKSQTAPTSISARHVMETTPCLNMKTSATLEENSKRLPTPIKVAPLESFLKDYPKKEFLIKELVGTLRRSRSKTELVSER